MTERKQENDGQFVYHELTPAIVVRFKSDVLLSINGNAIAGALGALGDKQPDLSPCRVIVSFLPAAGDDQGYWDFSEIPASTSTGHEQIRLVLDNIRGLVTRMEFSAPDSGIDVLCLAKSGMLDRLMLMELCPVKLSERFEAESRMADIPGWSSACGQQRQLQRHSAWRVRLLKN